MSDRTQVTSDLAEGAQLEDIRRAMQVSVDPRAARTRQAIIAAVHELVAERDTAPSVTEIVKRAGVSRSSFYTQFANSDELTAALFREAIEALESDRQAELVRGTAGADAIRTAVARFVRHVADHRSFYQAGLPTTIAAHNETVAWLAGQFAQTAPLASSERSADTIRATALYLAGGTLAILRSWVVGELTGSVEQITDEIMGVLPAWLVHDPSP